MMFFPDRCFFHALNWISFTSATWWHHRVGNLTPTQWQPNKHVDPHFDAVIDWVIGYIPLPISDDTVLTMRLSPTSQNTRLLFVGSDPWFLPSSYSIRSALCDGLLLTSGLFVFVWLCNHCYLDDVQASKCLVASLLGQYHASYY